MSNQCSFSTLIYTEKKIISIERSDQNFTREHRLPNAIIIGAPKCGLNLKLFNVIYV